MSGSYEELEKHLYDFSALCRGCLTSSGDMKNMYEWGLAEDFADFTRIQLTRTDNVSELLCADCEDALLSCRQFRTKCQSHDKFLQTAAKNINPEQAAAYHQENTISYLHLSNKLVLQITAPDMTSKISLGCTYCSQKYAKKKDIRSHIIKNHQFGENFDIELQYYCHIPDCAYCIDSGKEKFFKERKFLNQHYNKVHLDKVFQCEQCNISFSTLSHLLRHIKTCNITYVCEVCNKTYDSNEKLLVHLLRKHPDLHKQYKDEKKTLKRNTEVKNYTESKKSKTDFEKLNEFICDSPKRSFATQTLEENIKNDVTLPSWQTKSDETKTDEISTQTVFEDLLSLKSQTSEDDSIFFSENVSLSDIQTQTFPLEFGLSRSNKETITSETQSPDLSIKETQTCFCLYDSPKPNFKLFDSVISSPYSLNLTSTQTQTSELQTPLKSDVMLSFNSAETQTSFDDASKANL